MKTLIGNLLVCGFIGGASYLTLWMLLDMFLAQ